MTTSTASLYCGPVLRHPAALRSRLSLAPRYAVDYCAEGEYGLMLAARDGADVHEYRPTRIICAIPPCIVAIAFERIAILNCCIGSIVLTGEGRRSSSGAGLEHVPKKLTERTCSNSLSLSDSLSIR
jgi:hypothetical protein